MISPSCYRGLGRPLKGDKRIYLRISFRGHSSTFVFVRSHRDHNTRRQCPDASESSPMHIPDRSGLVACSQQQSTHTQSLSSSSVEYALPQASPTPAATRVDEDLRPSHGPGVQERDSESNDPDVGGADTQNISERNNKWFIKSHVGIYFHMPVLSFTAVFQDYLSTLPPPASCCVR